MFRGPDDRKPLLSSPRKHTPQVVGGAARARTTREVQYLNGYVSEQGRQAGVPTPFNDKLVELITRVPPGNSSGRRSASSSE